MDHNLKKYRVLKIKKQLKDSTLLLLYHSAKIKLDKWMLTEQRLKKIKFEYNQVYNGTTIKTFNNSIYKNMSHIIQGVLIFTTPSYKSIEIPLKTVKNNLEPSFILLFLKLNNKFYSVQQFKNLNNLSYKKTVFNFTRNLERYSKTTYKLTNKSK